jgi:hypothetical protein
LLSIANLKVSSSSCFLEFFTFGSTEPKVKNTRKQDENDNLKDTDRLGFFPSDNEEELSCRSAIELYKMTSLSVNDSNRKTAQIGLGFYQRARIKPLTPCKFILFRSLSILNKYLAL